MAKRGTLGGMGSKKKMAAHQVGTLITYNRSAAFITFQCVVELGGISGVNRIIACINSSHITESKGSTNNSR
jgi:hypothetical protein